MKKFEYSINKKLINKADIDSNKNRCFVNQYGTAQDLANAIDMGFAFWAKCQQNKTRNKNNFISSNILTLDFDKEYTLKEALDNEFIKQYATIIYKTPNYTEEQNRFRIIFELEFPIKDKIAFEQAILGLLKKFPQADKSCIDCSRFFYGSKNSNPQVFDKFIPKEIVSELIQEGKDLHDFQEDFVDDDFDKSFYTKEKIERILTYIEKEPGYDVWRNIVWAVADLLNDEDVFEVIENWSPDIKDNGKHLKSLIKNFRKRAGNKKIITFKTLLWEAQKRGYKIKAKRSNKIAGHIALKELFNNGIGYITINSTLYKYNNKYYEELEEGLVLSKLTHFFDLYQDSKGNLPFAKPHFVTEAYTYILRKTRIDSNKINPAGINVNNGYLEISYDENKKPKFELIPHSPDYYFTYCANFDYNPEAPSDYFDKVLNDMIDEKKQSILLRVIASSFDLLEVRKRFARKIRILLLLGEGSNGKDTIHEWVEQLYAGQGITAIPLQAFKTADKSREFSLAGLATSKVNWASESEVVALERCKNLINFATGDSMKVEEKYKNPVIIKPAAIGIFNLNSLPYLESNIEAVLSRFAIIKFETTFSSNPKGNQKKADPRLKEDKDFVCKEILPAFLNRLIKEFNLLLEEGIDYSTIEGALFDMQYSSSHLHRYIEDCDIYECELEEGISPSELMLHYCKWSEIQEIMELNASGYCSRVINVNKYDKPITDVTTITKRFKSIFPNLMYGKDKNGNRKIGLRIGNLNAITSDVNY